MNAYSRISTAAIVRKGAPFTLSGTTLNHLSSVTASDPALRDSVVVCRNAWKKIIRHWETTFEHQFGHKPTLDDKENKRVWYESYKACATQAKIAV
jgi:hypothetical protein